MHIGSPKGERTLSTSSYKIKGEGDSRRGYEQLIWLCSGSRVIVDFSEEMGFQVDYEGLTGGGESDVLG